MGSADASKADEALASLGIFDTKPGAGRACGSWSCILARSGFQQGADHHRARKEGFAFHVVAVSRSWMRTPARQTDRERPRRWSKGCARRPSIARETRTICPHLCHALADGQPEPGLRAKATRAQFDFDQHGCVLSLVYRRGQGWAGRGV